MIVIQQINFQLITFQQKTCIWCVYLYMSDFMFNAPIDWQTHTALKNVLFQNNMGFVGIQMIIYIHSIWLKSAYTRNNPLEAIKPHPIWKMFLENKNREFLQLKYPQPLPANKWPNHLLMNFTQLKVSCTQANMNMLKHHYFPILTVMDAPQFRRTISEHR